MKTQFTIKHSVYMMTIAEVIEAVEEITGAKVVKIDNTDTTLTVYLEYPQPAPVIENEEEYGTEERYHDEHNAYYCVCGCPHHSCACDLT